MRMIEVERYTKKDRDGESEREKETERMKKNDANTTEKKTQYNFIPRSWRDNACLYACIRNCTVVE